jgi:hypothetical protein
MNGSARFLVVKVGTATLAIPSDRVRCVARRPAVSWCGDDLRGIAVRLASFDGDPVVVRPVRDLLGVDAFPEGENRWLLIASGTDRPAAATFVDEILGLVRDDHDAMEHATRISKVALV